MKMKLIRDKRCKRKTGYRVVRGNPKLMAAYLIAKLHEETEEVREAMTDVNEYGDCLQVLMDLARVNGVKWRHVRRAQRAKWYEAGGFTKPRFAVSE